MDVQVPINAAVAVFIGNVFKPHGKRHAASGRKWMKALMQNERQHVLGLMDTYSTRYDCNFPDPRFNQVLGVAVVKFATSYNGAPNVHQV